jgi:phospholipid/cholesterol/gamma-HCH transport system substrate-binding protein
MNWFLKQSKVLGVLFIALVMLGVYLTYATFTKKFTDYEKVTLETSTIGLQLPLRGDVKYRGVIVGEVLDYTSTADGADVTLGLYPDQVDVIPADVTGSILPKTLFGEKFVSLVAPDSPSDDHIRAGATIDRTQVSIEVEKVLADLYPLLEAVEPAQLNLTLNALATALEGRGEALGENLEIVDSYLKRFNPKIPDLVEDLRLTADVSDIYSDVLPEVATILDNTITTFGTLEEKEEQATALYGNIADFADTSRTFLAENETNIIRSAELSAAQLRVFSRYAPQFPCLTGGIVNAGVAQAEAFRGFVLHIVLETLPRQPRAYDAGDRPRLGENRGPNCLHLPNPPWSQSNPVRFQPNFDDGVDRSTGKGTSRPPSGYLVTDGEGYPGTADEAWLFRKLLAPSLGVTADEVGDLGPLLVGPMARGAEVSLR